MAIVLCFVLMLLGAYCVEKFNPFPGEKWESGIVDLGNGGDDIFYYFFEARDPKPDVPRPLILWLTGGPGCSSSMGLFMEMGPYTFNRTTFVYSRNPDSWNNFADLLFVDQPVGTGFSKAKTRHECTTQLCVTRNFYIFFKKFLAMHPTLKAHPFYLTGESYAGKYVPVIANYLLTVNDPDINVAGLLIGGGMINRFIQRSLDPLFFYKYGYYSLSKYLAARTSTMLCEITNATHYHDIALPFCVKMRPYFFPPQIINDDDITDNETYDKLIEHVEMFINKPEMKQVLGVEGREFKMCNGEVEKDFFDDFLISQDQTIGEVLKKGAKVMLYVGMHDSGSHWIGLEQVVLGINWEGKNEFVKAPYEEWKVEEHHFADIKKYNKFSFVKLFDAGHMSPMNQPHYCYKMLEEFVWKF